MDAMNFRVLKRAEPRESNYRLLGEPVKLSARCVPVLDGPDEQQWESEGGALAPPPYEVDIEEKHRRDLRTRVGRKQTAARCVVPKESIKVVRIEQPAPMEVVEVRLRGGTEQDEEVASLEHRIKELMAVVQAPIIAERRRKESIERFEELFNVQRKVR